MRNYSLNERNPYNLLISYKSFYQISSFDIKSLESLISPVQG